MIKTIEETMKDFETKTIADLKSNKEGSKMKHIGDDIFVINVPTDCKHHEEADKYRYHVITIASKCKGCNNKKIAVNRGEKAEKSNNTWIELCFDCHNMNTQANL